jgi:isoamylase
LELQVLPGRPSPLGSSWDGLGVNFAIFSENATKIELCLFDARDPANQIGCITLPEVTSHVFHGYVIGLRPGQLYGYRVHGPHQPEQGLRFNPSKVLIDPYARALAGEVDWSQPMFGYRMGDAAEDLSLDEQDSGRGVPKAVVVDNTFNWDGDRRPRTPWHETVIYEVHVKGFTKQHPQVPADQRGTYSGLASPPMIDYLKKLGVTAVELLPVHAFVDDKMLLDKGLRNYWGYNTINFFSPDARYASVGDRGEQVAEFKAMVRELHRAGIEVILDVVYNHTAEGNHLGPTLSFKGIDNRTYYRTVPDNPRYYMDYTGTGNTFNTMHPQVLKLLMDSLRYWVTEMHVDGFRFDLASTLARELFEVDRLSAFFDTIHQDPVLSEVKLIAEPWDVGPGGYQVGNFPVLWSEWNGKYRDAVRAYWKGEAGQMPDFAYRFTGSSDLYGDDGRRPHSSINFIVAHDGFTLNDLVSYNEKHNEANGENNNDGDNNNHSWNCGVEGPTDDEAVNELRERQRRNFLATLFLSQGTPMLCGGDEIGRTQRGNNNAYCQDNEISWYNWDLSQSSRNLLRFTRRMIALRNEHPALRRRKFFKGRKIWGADVKDITWFRPDGKEMSEQDWNAGWSQALAVRLGGDALGDLDPRTGLPITDTDLLILVNSSHLPVTYTLPAPAEGEKWQALVDTSNTLGVPAIASFDGNGRYELCDRAVAVLAQSDRAREE